MLSLIKDGSILTKYFIGIVLTFCLGCSTVPKLQIAPNQVILQKGLGTVLSEGLDTLSDKIKFNQTAVLVCSYSDWQFVTEQLIELKPKKIILIGHSLGADNSILASKKLKTQGINVDLLILIDSFNPEKIPSNVNVCYNFYVANLLGNNHQVSAESSNTILKNIPISADNHLSVDNDPDVHDAILKQLNSILN